MPQKTFVTATTTRRKQQQELIHRALLAEEDRRRKARETFHMTSVPLTSHAAYEPALHHVGEEHEEGRSYVCDASVTAALPRRRNTSLGCYGDL